MNSLRLEIDTVCRELGQHAMDKGVMFATAESCTAGGISYYITAVPGSSQWFDRGFVTYSNEAKMDLLGVQQTTLSAHGAVSEETAEEMVRGALDRSRAHVAVAVTGIAGPGGAVPGKPVGTVCFGFARRSEDGVHVNTCTEHFPGDRNDVRHATVFFAVQGLLEELERI